MSCRHRSVVGSMATPPPHSPDCNPEEDIHSEADSDAADHSYLSSKPFEWVMEKSRVKTRPSEQTVLRVDADLLLGPDSSLDMDSETDDQSYSPTEVYALTWHGYTAYIMHLVSCIA
ncbi:hypothetical protein ACQJBY_048683 [Aegilops geniculata]